MAISDRFKNFAIIEETQEEVVSPEITLLCSELTQELSKKIAAIPIWFDYTKQEQTDLIKAFLNAQLNDKFQDIKLTKPEKDRVIKNFFNSVYGFGPLDYLLSQKNITRVFVDSPDCIYVEQSGKIRGTDIHIDKHQFLSLLKKLIDMSGKNSKIITFRYQNLLVNIIREPICKPKFILSKISDALLNFDNLERKKISNRYISNLLRNMIKNKKHILISSRVQSGKTTFLNSILNEITNEEKVVLFEEGNLINTENIFINRYDIEGIETKEQHKVISLASYFKPDYVFTDINAIELMYEIFDVFESNTGFITTIRSNSPQEAVSIYSSLVVSRLKCTEKLAKSKFAKVFDYIIQIEKKENAFIIKSIYEVSTNKTGSIVLTELLSYESGNYVYNLDNLQKSDANLILPENKLETKRNLQFSARFYEE